MENVYPFKPLLKPMSHLASDRVLLTELEVEERKNATALNPFQANVQFLYRLATSEKCSTCFPVFIIWNIELKRATQTFGSKVTIIYTNS